MSDLQRIKYSLHFSSLYLHKPSVDNVSHSSNPSWINTDLLPSQTLIIHSAHFHILSLSRKEKKTKKEAEGREGGGGKQTSSLSPISRLKRLRVFSAFQESAIKLLSRLLWWTGAECYSASTRSRCFSHAACLSLPLSLQLSHLDLLLSLSPFLSLFTQGLSPAYHFGMLPLSVSLSLSQAFSSIYCAAFSFLFLFLNLEVLFSLLQSLSHTLSVFLSLKLNLHLSQFTLLALPYSAICQSPLSHIYIYVYR